MKVTLLSAIAIQFSALISSALVAADGASLIPDPDLKGSADVSYPVVLADVVDEATSALANQASDLPDYCYDDPDYECYKKGVPKCCNRSRLTCPVDKPRCRSRHYRRHSSRAIIPAGDYCTAGVDICVRGYKCVDGICKAVSGAAIARGGVCRVGVDVCVRGTACLSGRCTVPPIPAGGVCYDGDVCVRGYFCNNGRCDPTSRSRIIRRGGVCQAGDICESGYTCIGGRCNILPIPAGGVCYDGDVCEKGYFCNNGRCDPTSRSRIIRRGGVCLPGDICETGSTCVNGRCASLPIPVGGVCSPGDVCASGSFCQNGICSSGMWYTNWQYCVMDCPLSAGSCCGGQAQSWDQVYGSADACCGQSAFQGNHDGCLNRSLQCARQENGEMEKSIE